MIIEVFANDDCPEAYDHYVTATGEILVLTLKPDRIEGIVQMVLERGPSEFPTEEQRLAVIMLQMTYHRQKPTTIKWYEVMPIPENE